jgi:hypothetical protein
MMMQAASLLGAGMILAAYATHQAGLMGRDSVGYHVLNLAGALVLCVVAVEAFQVGFIVLEGAWALISLAAFVRTVRRPAAGG